jgi:large subunit ribosomal protein L13
MGKYSPEYSRQVDAGDFVVVVNAAHLTWTGSRKGKQTIFSRHSGYPGGLRMERLEDLHKRDPVKVLRILVSSMLPKATNQRARLLKRVKIYPEANHPHAAQKPQAR